MVAIQKWRCPAKFLNVFFLLSLIGSLLKGFTKLASFLAGSCLSHQLPRLSKATSRNPHTRISLDDPAILNADRQAIRANRFAENPYFFNLKAIRSNRLKPAIFWCPDKRFAVRKPRIKLKRFARIGPSKSASYTRREIAVSERHNCMGLEFQCISKDDDNGENHH